MNSWRLATIDALCARVTSGGTPSRSNPDFYTNNGIPWIKTAELSDGYIYGSEEHITHEAIANSSAKILPQGAVLMAMYGATVGKLGILGVDAACNQASCAMIADPEVAVGRWLFYALLNSRDEITNLANGAAQQNLSAATIKKHSFMVPPLDEQQVIAEVLSALDDKIAANARLLTLADELASAIFLGSDRVDQLPLSSTARFVNGKAYTKDATGTGRVVIRIAELNSGIGPSTVYNDIEVEDDNLARPGDLLFAWSGSLTLHRWFRPEGIVNQHIFKVIPNEGYPRWLVFELIRRKLEEFKAIAADKATTMGHIQRRHLDEVVAVPDPATIATLDQRMTPLWDRALGAEVENLHLADLRDALLPQLMSGKLRVKDAEKVVAAAV